MQHAWDWESEPVSKGTDMQGEKTCNAQYGHTFHIAIINADNLA